jgi:hypothetical protein
MNHLALFHKGIAECLAEYQRAPFNFLFERDLQAILFSSCYRALAGERIRMEGGYHPVAAYGGQSGIDTIPVKCEYPNSRVFDVALIDGSRLESYDQEVRRQRAWKNDRFWNQHVRAAVEVKYYQLGDILRVKAAGFEKDVKKLMTYAEESPASPFLGIALLFVQSNTLECAKFGVGRPLDSSDSPPEAGIFRYVVTPSSVRRFAA